VSIVEAEYPSTIVGSLVELTQRVTYEALSPSVIVAARRAILDAIGCAIAAQGCEPARIAGSVLPQGGGEATVIGEAGKSSVDRAVLVNGILVRYLDFMDVYWSKDICHPAENVPLALACVESAGGNGKALIEAVVAAYEAQLRLTHAFSLTQIGMHHVTAAGIVAPLVIGKAWGVDPQTIAHAVALGGCRQFTLHALSKGKLSMAKAIGYPWSAMTSVLAMRLAQAGFTGPVEFIDWLSKDGPLKGDVDRAALAHDGMYLVEGVSYKQYPVQFELQTPVEIAIALCSQVQAAGSDIDAVTIEVLPASIARTADASKFAPRNRETADHSLPVCTAMALLDGKLTAHQFETDRWADADVASLVQRTTVVASEDYAQRYPGGRPARVAIKLENGSELSEFQSVPSGDATRPLDDAALERKFRNNATARIGERRADEIVRYVHSLERLGHVGELTRLLAAS
jgi:2-methylcitrate dehydratase